MSVYIKPCHGCPIGRNGCDIRDGFRASVSKINGLSSAKFKCPRIPDEIRPGRRVIVSNVVIGNDVSQYGEYTAKRSAVNATVFSVNNGKFSFVIDPGQVSENIDDHLKSFDITRVRFRRNRPIRDIKEFLDEPDAERCALGYIQRNGECDTPDGICVCKSWE